MHDLQTINRINDEQAAKVRGIVTNHNHSARLKEIRDRKVNKERRSKPKLGEYDFACEKCGRVHHKSTYFIAQQAMGNSIVFTCDCGHKQDVP